MNVEKHVKAESNTDRTEVAGSSSSLDYRFYQRSCELSGDTPSLSDFNNGRAKGLYRFTENDKLLNGLVSLYHLNLHNISGEWLSFSSRPGQISAFGATPLQAVLAWVVNQPVDTLLP